MKVSITLTPKQTEFASDPSKRKIAVCGRRGGKTYTVMTMLLRDLTNKNHEYTYLTDTRKHAKEIFWRPFKKLLPKQWIKKISETDLEITTITDTVLKVRGANYYDSLVGGLNHGIYLDEAQLINELAWTEALQPTLGTTNGFCVVSGTPIVNTWIEEYVNKEGWSSHRWTTAEGGILTPDFIEEARRELDERTFRSQYLAEFTTSEGAIFYAFDDDSIVDVNINPNDTIYLSFDFNVNPMTCVIFQNDIAVKEFEIANSNTIDISNRIIRFLEQNKFSGSVYITGDATGNNRHASASSTNYKILRDIFEPYLAKGEYAVKTRHVSNIEDRFLTANTALCSYTGERKLFISKNCTQLIKYLKSVDRKDFKNDVRGVTHLTDAFTYYPYNFHRIKTKLYTI
jgi:hypothetical protein